MRLKILESELIRSGFVDYKIDELTRSLIIKIDVKPKSYNLTPKNERDTNTIVSFFTLNYYKDDAIRSSNYRLGTTFNISEYRVKVKSKDCSSVKCSIESMMNDLKGEVLLDTHGILVKIWRIDLEYTNILNETIKVRAVHD